jgi:hypothetical protein
VGLKLREGGFEVGEVVVSVSYFVVVFVFFPGVFLARTRVERNLGTILDKFVVDAGE